MHSQRSPSLTRTVTLLVAVTVLSTATLAGIFSYAQSNHQLEEVFDAELAQSTRIVQGLVRHLTRSQSLQELTRTLSETLTLPAPAQEEGEGSEILPDGAGHKYEKKIAFQIWSPKGELLLSTRLRNQLFDPTPGYRWVDYQGFSWRTYNLQDPATGLWIQTAQREDVRGELSQQLALGNTLPLLLVLPLLGVAIAVAIHWGFAPLRRLEAPVRDMAPQAIHPLDDQAAPKEVRGLVLAINGLLQRLDDALGRERRFSADAAHELRTPLAALRLNLERICDENPGRYDGLIQAVDRMSHLVEQMLLLSRVDSGLDFKPDYHNLSQILAQSIADVAPLALKKGIEPELLDDTSQAIILCNSALVSTMVRSLLANAIQYSPSGTVVSTHLEATQDGYRISVCDQGPGIAAEDRERAAGRFVRLDQRQGSGAGLGLAIARRVAELHGGSLSLTDREDGHSGLCVVLVLPTKSA
ncbi:ATP-binding protein [Marinobacter zhejiangensis]|uniref:histidine kinase n=1 Tax=Marinobacter zhejiangensis TaxID=488535 RepID=A0A1I4M7M6_9GAMM|nr:ATP-binding protein [Marinobacter zhejiangensis]SFL99103.1 two-component system, OmpR family, sensor histidine kinase QseC [Marinobacter zhejiangensis]